MRTKAIFHKVVLVTATHMNVRPDDILGKRKTDDIVPTRWAVWRVLHNDYGMSISAISQITGKDCSTIRNGLACAKRNSAASSRKSEVAEQIAEMVREKVKLPLKQTPGKSIRLARLSIDTVKRNILPPLEAANTNRKLVAPFSPEVAKLLNRGFSVGGAIKSTVK